MYANRVYRIETRNFFLFSLIFLFFFTLSADLLNVKAILFKIKVNHILGLLLTILSVPIFRIFSVNKQIFYCSLYLLSSLLISSCFSLVKVRSMGYTLIYLFEFFCYFLIPIHLIFHFNHKKILKIYWASFILTGLYAAFQLVFSFFGIIDPFLGQFLGKYARAHAMAYEPSFYALYMSIFVMFFNTKILLSIKNLFRFKTITSLLLVNLFLIISTSTGGFFAYFIFLATVAVFCCFKNIDKSYLLKNTLKLIFFFCLLFFSFAICFPNIFLTTFFKFFTGLAFNHWSFVLRWKGMVNSWNVFIENPLFGVGLGGVGPYLFKRHSPTGALPENLSELEIYDPTNVLTEILASLGLYGFVALIMLGIFIFYLFKKTISLETVHQEDKQYAISLFVSLVVSMVVLQFNQGLFRTYLWVHTAMNVGFFLKMIHLHERRTIYDQSNSIQTESKSTK